LTVKAQPQRGSPTILEERVTPAEDAAAPLYQRIVADLRAEIAAGVLPPGARLPTERALRARFGVSRHTVREALRALRAEGLVTSRQGAGTTVVADGTPPLYVHAVASVDELLHYATETRYRPDGAGFVTVDALLAARLGCAVGTRWLRVEGFRYAGDAALPICWTEVFVRAEYDRVGDLIFHQPGPVYTLIEALYGERVAEVQQTLRATALPMAVARGLSAEPGSMGLEIARAYRTAAGRLIEVAFNLHPADRFVYTMTLRRGDLTGTVTGRNLSVPNSHKPAPASPSVASKGADTGK
jgi:GntR family transcriptional regulator